MSSTIIKITPVWLVVLAILLTNCKRCDGGLECCNPETSRIYIPVYLKDWLPYHTGDSFDLTHQNTNPLQLNVAHLTRKDTGYFQGDECPLRRGEFESGEITFPADTLFFETDYLRSLIVGIDQIEFRINDYSNGRYTSPNNDWTQVEMRDSVSLAGSKFHDVIIAQSDSGNIQKIYLAHAVGIIGVQRNDTTWVLP